MRTGHIRAASAAIAVLALTPQAGAILVMDNAYTDGDVGLAKDLAAEPQFAAVIDFMPVKEDMRASRVWIGNDNSHGYILTAAHNFCDVQVTDFTYFTVELNEHLPVKVTVDPDYICGSFSRMGYDLAIVELADKVDTSGPQPTLYDGENELNHVLTFVGYGMRGTGTTGAIEGADQVPAAAQSMISAIATGLKQMPSDPEADTGNFLVTDFVADGGTVDPETKETIMPVSKYAGAVAVGDSGGPAYIQLGDAWFVAGINESGTGDHYGDTSHFVRVSGTKDWILSVFPGAKFGHEGE